MEEEITSVLRKEARNNDSPSVDGTDGLCLQCLPLCSQLHCIKVQIKMLFFKAQCTSVIK